MRNIVSILFLFSFFFGKAQNIKTIQLRPLGGEQYSSIAPLGSVLELSFDDLDGDNKEYQYKIEHMTPNWESSNLIPSQYIRGFEQNTINNTSNSFNTLQSYTHYSVQIPNQNTIITKSGNYLISILDEDYNIVFTRRFVLYEKLTTVGVSTFRSRNIENSNTQQTVQFFVNHSGLQINNPAQEISIALLQNNDWNTVISNLKPQFFETNQLIYNYTQTSNFWGGNEFLNFDNKYIRNTTLNIAKTEQKEVFHNYLHTDKLRKNSSYTYNPDINGQFVIRTLDADNANTEADYAMIHFALDKNEPYQNKEVFVYGAFNNFELTEENKMHYNKESKMYEANFLLKQGFYNYNYVTLNENEIIDLTEVNGSFFQTENEYTVLVYYKPFGEIYHRVIGFGNTFFDQNR